jgi:SAM-dependent methyltransferase
VRLNEAVVIWMCGECTNAMTIPAPAASYDDHQFFQLAGLDEPRWRRYSSQLVDFITRHDTGRGRLLDVGCSHGFLVEEAARRGFLAEGVEPSRSGAEYCRQRGLAVRHGYLEEGTFPPRTFDVLVMAHVIEHLADPISLLRTARRVLSQAGLLCLSQTNYSGTLPRLLGRRWPYWVAHEHYYHFTPEGIERVLNAAGFERVALELVPLGYYPDFRLRSLRLIPGIALNTFDYLVSRWRIGWPYRGDQMYVLARARAAKGAAPRQPGP